MQKTASTLLQCRTIDSPIGPLVLAGPGGVLTNLRMLDQTHEPNRTGWVPDDRAFPDAVSRPTSPVSEPISISSSALRAASFSGASGRRC